MPIQEKNLSEDQERQILSEVVTCFDKASEDRRAIFSCLNIYLQKFGDMSRGSSQKVSEFAKEAFRITLAIFEECIAPKKPLGIDITDLDFDDKNFYEIQLKKALA